MNKKLSLIFGIMFIMVIGSVSAYGWDFGCYGQEPQTRDCSEGTGIETKICEFTPSYCESGHWNNGYWKNGHYHPSYCDDGYWHNPSWKWSEWDNSACVIEPEVQEPTTVPKPVKVVESHGDGSCVVDWVCENGVAVKEKEFDPLPNSNWTREEKIAHGYKFLDSKYCVALPWKKPDCSGSVNEVTVVPLEQEPVSEQVLIDDTLSDSKESNWLFQKIKSWVEYNFGI